MAKEPQRDERAARKEQLNDQIRAGVAGELNQCVHHAVTLCHSGAQEIRCTLVNGMLLAERIPLISDHDRFVARLFRVRVNKAAGRELGAWARRQGIKVDFELQREHDIDVIYVLLAAR